MFEREYSVFSFCCCRIEMNEDMVGNNPGLVKPISKGAGACDI